MTHITEARFIGNHADMGASRPVASRTPLTATEVIRAGLRRKARRRARRSDMVAARSAWESEGGATKRGTTDGEG
jgi:hypothetical protein